MYLEVVHTLTDLLMPLFPHTTASYTLEELSIVLCNTSLLSFFLSLFCFIHSVFISFLHYFICCFFCLRFFLPSFLCFMCSFSLFDQFFGSSFFNYLFRFSSICCYLLYSFTSPFCLTFFHSLLLSLILFSLLLYPLLLSSAIIICLCIYLFSYLTTLSVAQTIQRRMNNA
jgi:hypothetical protein